MSLFYDTKQSSYQQQRSVSQGAGITLVVGAGEYTASFDCATRIAQVMGNRELQDVGDGIFESIPVYKIPVNEMFSVLQKLSARFSIALVELVCGNKSSQFVLVWKILPAPAKVTLPISPINLDDY